MGLIGDVRMDLNIHYTNVVGENVLWDVHNKWQEFMAIRMQYVIANQLGRNYINNSANKYYVKDGIYCYVNNNGFIVEYGASPVNWSKRLIISKPCAWYFGATLEGAIKIE